MHIDKKRDFYIIIFKNISAAYMFENNFIIVKHRRLKRTRFFITEKVAGMICSTEILLEYSWHSVNFRI